MILTTKKQDKRTKRKLVHSLLGRQMKKNVLITVTSMRQRKVTEEIQRLSPLEFVVQFSTMEPQRDRWWAEPYQKFISDKHFHTSINLLVLYHSCCNLIGYQTHDCLKNGFHVAARLFAATRAGAFRHICLFGTLDGRRIIA